MENKGFYVVDGHCDSIELVADRGAPLVGRYNFSAEYPQLQFTAVWCCHPDDTPEECRARAFRYFDAFDRATERESGAIVRVRTWSEIERALASGRHAALLTEEGGSGIRGSVRTFREMFDAGVRVFGLAWLSNDLAKSNRLAGDEEDTGLTGLGREIIAEGNRLGMIFDVSHLSDRSFRDVIESAEKPPVATHSNFRSVCSHSRNLTDEMAEAIVSRGGMIGLNLCTSFVSDDPERRTVEGLFDHIDHALRLGFEDCLGFGCDIDGVGGVYPAPLSEESSIHDSLIRLMREHGYKEDLIEKIAYKNWLRYLKENLPE